MSSYFAHILKILEQANMKMQTYHLENVYHQGITTTGYRLVE